MTRRDWLALAMALAVVSGLAAANAPAAGALLLAAITAVAAILCLDRAGVMR